MIVYSSLLGILLMNLLAFILIIIRPKLYNTKLYKPMVLNIGLSVLPVIILTAIAFSMIRLGQYGYQNQQYGFIIAGFILSLIGLLIWLLLLPNAGYLITELNLNHRNNDKNQVPLWYDIISVLSLSLSGIFNTFVNVMLIQVLYVLLFNLQNEMPFQTLENWVLSVGLFFLVSLGMYLGRYIRFNSWDVVKPSRFISKLVSHFKEPGVLKNSLLFVLLHTIFFTITYFIVFNTLMEGILPILWKI